MPEQKRFWSQSWDLFATWLALVGLLTLTCALAYVPLGHANLAVSLAIATVKALLVALIFMSLARKNALNRLVACVAPLWLFIMFCLMASDYFTR